MVRRGYKACPNCTLEIPVACRTCPNCNAGVRGDTRSSTAAVSPVQCGRLLRFKRVRLGSPDRSRSVRNHAGRSAAVAQTAQQNRDLQNSAEAQNQPSSGHQLEDLGGNSTAVSPVAHGRLTNSDGDILSAYVSQLKIGQNRCLSVAQDEHGVVCYAVAGHVLGPGGSVSISVCPSSVAALVIISRDLLWPYLFTHILSRYNKSLDLSLCRPGLHNMSWRCRCCTQRMSGIIAICAAART